MSQPTNSKFGVRPVQKLVLFLFSLFLSACNSQQSRINGISFVGSPNPIDRSAVIPVKEMHANWVAIMPFGFLYTLNSPKITFNSPDQWWGERSEGVVQTVRLFRDQKIQVMLKPQLWVWKGEFTGEIAMQSEKDWVQFEASYERFILFYARLANRLKIPILCIGTELHTFTQKRKYFWQQLIVKIKKYYNGKLTYAENWDQFEKFPNWEQLDYIGIDAYFPLSTAKEPSIKELRTAWIPVKNQIQQLQKKHKKPILFTEFGYRSMDFAAKRPWEVSNAEQKVNMLAQKNALESIFDIFWDEPWFMGGFVWKWFGNHEQSGGEKDNRFTIQNKPAQDLVRKIYAKYAKQ